ncbi:hypothetical protein ABBQ32_003564 [Trebouxia sp. C0010 RCD-2024]
MQWLNTGCCSWCLHQGWQQLGTSTPSSWASLTRTMTKAQCSNAVHLKAEADQEQCELHDKLASLGRRKGSVVCTTHIETQRGKVKACAIKDIKDSPWVIRRVQKSVPFGRLLTFRASQSAVVSYWTLR